MTELQIFAYAVAGVLMVIAGVFGWLAVKTQREVWESRRRMSDLRMKMLEAQMDYIFGPAPKKTKADGKVIYLNPDDAPEKNDA